MSSVGRFTTMRADCGNFEEEKQVYTSKQATVEVTVKVKKRRHPHEMDNKGAALPSKSLNFRKGSWGDLLSQNKLAEVKEDLKDGKTKVKHTEFKCSASEDGDTPKSLCHKIPITDDLYLETHTHVRSKSSSPYDGNKKAVTATVYASDQNRNRREKNYEVENDYLRGEIERLRKEVQKVKVKSQKKKTPGRAEDSYASYIKKRPAEIVCAPSATTVASQSRVKSRQQQPPPSARKSEAKARLPPLPQIPMESKHTSTTSITPVILVEKRSEITQTDGKAQIKERLDANQKQMDLMLEEENKALRKEAGELLAEMQKAQREQQESIMTIRELYQLAELLKRENQELLGAQEQQQFLQEKLVEAISENQDLKKYLDTLVQKQKECSNVHGDQMAKIRNVIEEVKSTIQDEIHGISGSQASVYEKPEYTRAFNLNLTEEQSALLNETNASELQRIFGDHDESFRQMAKEVFMKATGQIGQDKGVSTSTPTPLGLNSGRSSSGSQQRLSPFTQDVQSGGNNGTSGGINLESLAQDVSRTFKPIQMELMNGSSSSDYRSTTSTPTNMHG